MSDSRFVLDNRFAEESEAESSTSQTSRIRDLNPEQEDRSRGDPLSDQSEDEEGDDELGNGMLPEGFAGPSDKVVKPLTAEDLAKFQAVQEKTGVIYISRIPPGMRPTKVRHIMSGYGEVGRVYLQPEDPKRAYLRRKYTSTKKMHFTEGWVEFKDKKIARSIADMLNAQPIGGKKGTRWRDDIWTMKYLPKFKWHMLTEQIAHEAAMHAARLRVELSQSKREQQEYLKNVELARVLDKRAERKRKAGDDVPPPKEYTKKQKKGEFQGDTTSEKRKGRDIREPGNTEKQLSSVLSNIF